MSRRVFISFRYNDGILYKKRLENLFDYSDYVINCSESVDRSMFNDEKIKRYLYEKLANTSVTIVLLTPCSLNHEKNVWLNKYDDWMYDEIRYSLEYRKDNRSNGLIAVYTPEVEKRLFDNFNQYGYSGLSLYGLNNKKSCKINRIDNLCYYNYRNLKEEYSNKSTISKAMGMNISYNDYSYCSFYAWNDFVFNGNFERYIEEAANKREIIDHYEVCKNMNI